MRHIRAISIVMAGILSVLVPALRADSLQLKNGNFVQGKYLGGTDRSVQFGVNGKIRLYDIDEILSISFAAASADGGIPSNNAAPKPNADTASNSAARDNPGLRTTLWNQKKQLRVSAGSNRRVMAGNCDARTRVSAIPTRSVHVPPQRFPVLSD